MGYRKNPSKPWLVARKQGKHPIKVVAGMHYRLKKTAQKTARMLNRAYDGSQIHFVVRKEGFNRKRWWS